MKIIRPESTKTSRYNQVSQGVPIKFSFVNETSEGDYILLHTPFICRDYFNECVAGNRFKQIHSIYGFAWDPKKHSLDEDHTKLYVDVSDCLSRLEANFLQSMIFSLRDFELELGRSFTKIILTESPTEFIFIADKKWQETCLGMNIYTLLIKCICGIIHRNTKLEVISLPGVLDLAVDSHTRESQYLRNLRQRLQGRALNLYEALLFLSDGADLVEFDEPNGGYDYIAGLHNNSGISTFSTTLGLSEETKESSLSKVYSKFYSLADKFNEQFPIS